MEPILLANTQPITRSALAILLRARFDCAEIECAASWGELLACVDALQPKLILLDWDIPGFTPQTCREQLGKIASHTAVIVLVAQPEMRPVNLPDGITAVISRLDPPERLVELIRRVLFPNR